MTDTPEENVFSNLNQAFEAVRLEKPDAAMVLLLDRGDNKTALAAAANSEDKILNMLVGGLANVVLQSEEELNREMVVYSLMAILDIPFTDEFVAKGNAVMVSILEEGEAKQAASVSITT